MLAEAAELFFFCKTTLFDGHLMEKSSFQEKGHQFFCSLKRRLPALEHGFFDCFQFIPNLRVLKKGGAKLMVDGFVQPVMGLRPAVVLKVAILFGFFPIGLGLLPNLSNSQPGGGGANVRYRCPSAFFRWKQM